MTPDLSTAALLLGGLAVGAATAAARWREWHRPEPYTTEHAKWRYQRDDITFPEFRHRLAVLEDDEAMQVFAMLQEISGLGEQLAFDVAAAFPSEWRLRTASESDLQRVNGIGPSRAAAIKDLVGREPELVERYER